MRDPFARRARGHRIVVRRSVRGLPPRIEALCPIGAGDALGAAFAWSMEKKKSFSESLRWGVATGTAAAKLPGLAFPTFNDARAVYKQVELRHVK